MLAAPASFRSGSPGGIPIADPDGNNEEVSLFRCRDLSRLFGLSDGVFAFALTLLVLSLQVPLLTSTDTSTTLAEKLGQQWPEFLSYLISFFVIAAWWRSHHWIFSLIRRCNRSLFSLNFLFLLCITIIPFLTNLLSLHGDIFLATVLYAMVQAAAGFVLIGIWLYASQRNRLTDPRLGKRRIRYVTFLSFSPPAVFLLSVPIAAFSTMAAQFSWVLIPAFQIAVGRIYRDVREEMEEHREKEDSD